MEEIKNENYNHLAPIDINNRVRQESGTNSFSREKIDLTRNIQTPFDDSRKKLILGFFIEHFITMARKSNEFRNYGQVNRFSN